MEITVIYNKRRTVINCKYLSIHYWNLYVYYLFKIYKSISMYKYSGIFLCIFNIFSRLLKYLLVFYQWVGAIIIQ